MADHPLVSYCVKCYNQERYIGDALRAAFAQTYSPLEILICDDASTDRSDEIIRKSVCDYKASGGRHMVRHYRNDRNRGNLGNWQYMCELAEGELLVKADGDDWSVPERTAKLVDAWERDGRRATYLYSDGWAVSDSGQKLWDVKLHEDYCIGAFEAYAKACCTEFGAIESSLGHEGADDVVYLERGKMLGSGLHIPERLVWYRQGSGETSAGLNYVKMMTRGFRFMLASARQLQQDVEKIRGRIGEASYREHKDKFAWSIRHHSALLELWQGKTFSDRCQGYRTLMNLKSISPCLGKFLLLPRWFSNPPLNLLFCLKYRLKLFVLKRGKRNSE